MLYGRSSHHHVEAVFKAFARALRVACAEGRAAREDAAEHEGAAVIALIDYGAGNLTSVKKALASLGADVHGARDARRTARVRPASSCQAWATSPRPRRSAHRGATPLARAVDAGTPLLGICVGMQWLYEGSEEAPDVRGLGVLSGRCRLLQGDA